VQIGVIKEIKDREHRVALIPAGVAALVAKGHVVCVESGAGSGSGLTDAEYREAGAEIVTTDAAWSTDLVVKVKEPLESEYARLAGQMVFTYLHLAGVTPDLTQALVTSKTTAIAYETVEDESGHLPLLAPMSAVAGNMAIIVGAYYLAKFSGGKGTLLGKVQRVPYGKVVVIGDGVVGRHAAGAACGLGAGTVVFGRHPERETELKQTISADLNFELSSDEAIAGHLRSADLVVGAVLLPGAKAPHVVSREMVQAMQDGSVIVDVSIDQGGCVATSRPTSHSDPIFQVYGIIHYCVTNMPGAYPRTSTFALTEATLPYIERLADCGIEGLCDDPGFRRGVNTYGGYVTSEPVAQALGLSKRFAPLVELVA